MPLDKPIPTHEQHQRYEQSEKYSEAIEGGNQHRKGHLLLRKGVFTERDVHPANERGDTEMARQQRMGIKERNIPRPEK